MSQTSIEVVEGVRLTTTLPDRYRFTVTAQLEWVHPNPRPHFAVTGELRNLRRKGDNQIEAAGQMHDDARRYFPRLEPVIAVHLADDQGTPMHAVANGAYWLGLSDPRYLPDDPPQYATFARLWRIDEAEARAIYRACRAEPDPVAALRERAAGMADRWQADADRALAAIRAAQAGPAYLLAQEPGR